MKHRYLAIAATAGLTLALIALSSKTAQTFAKAPAPSLRVVSATLTASPEVYDGPCPVTIKFSGNITVKGKGLVKYTFVRSDGATGPVYTLDFAGDETKHVDTTWTLSPPTFGEWVAIKILSPTVLQSERASFKGTCLKEAEQSFRVTSAFLKADSSDNRGACPVTVNFGGDITTNGAGLVKYVFTRSDGATSGVQYLNFERAGTMRVSYQWTLGDSILSSYEGWVAIKVLAPNEIMSFHERGLAGYFTTTCTPASNAQNANGRISSLTANVAEPSPGSKGQFIACPVKETRTEVTTPLPQPWWNTPQVGKLERVSVETIGGNRTLVCEYWAYGRSVGIMRAFPEGATDCSAEGSGFLCR